MKFCSQCGKQLQDEALYCYSCGHKVAESVVQAESVLHINSQSENKIIPTRLCNFCSAVISETTVICPNCGNRLKSKNPPLVSVQQSENAKFCNSCGTKVNSSTPTCPRCGRLVDAPPHRGVILGFMIFSCAIWGLLFIVGILTSLHVLPVPLFWCLPMTIHYANVTREGNNVGTGFMVCSLLFVSQIAGIIMLCDAAKSK